MIRRRERRLLQQVPAENIGFVPVAETDAITPGFRLADGSDGQCQVKIRGIVQSLAGAQVHAARVAAALAQPDRVQRKALPVIELDGEFARQERT